MRHYEKLNHYRRKQRNRLSGRKTDCRYDHLPEIMKKAYAVKSKFPISPEEMAEIYTMPAVEDGYDGFLYNERGKEVKANRSAYDRDVQKRLAAILDQKINSCLHSTIRETETA